MEARERRGRERPAHVDRRVPCRRQAGVPAVGRGEGTRRALHVRSRDRRENAGGAPRSRRSRGFRIRPTRRHARRRRLHARRAVGEGARQGRAGSRPAAPADAELPGRVGFAAQLQRRRQPRRVPRHERPQPGLFYLFDGRRRRRSSCCPGRTGSTRRRWRRCSPSSTARATARRSTATSRCRRIRRQEPAADREPARRPVRPVRRLVVQPRGPALRDAATPCCR